LVCEQAPTHHCAGVVQPVSSRISGSRYFTWL
jgi:hypothetical protein